MSFAFLTASATDAVARSPMERQARAAGARFEVRDGWNVAVGYPKEAAALETFAFADASHLRKYEKQGDLPRARVREGHRRRREHVAADDAPRAR